MRRIAAIAWTSGLCLSGCAPAPQATAVECSEHAVCDDGFLCNGRELCVGGRCQLGTPPSCADGDPATYDGCTEGVGCVHVREPAAPAVSDAAAPDTRAEAGAETDAAVPIDAAPPAVGEGFVPAPNPGPQVPCATSLPELTLESMQMAAGVTCVEGAVQIDMRPDGDADAGPAEPDWGALAQLRRAGTLSLTLSGEVPRVVLPELRRVYGDLVVNVSGGAALPDFPALEWVDGRLLLTSPDAEEVPELGALQHTGGLAIDSRRASVSGFGSLTHVTGAVELDVRQVSGFGGLRSVERSLVLGATIERFDGMDSLRSSGGLTLIENPRLNTLEGLPALQVVFGVLHVEANPELRRLGLPSLERVRSLVVRLNPQLSRCEIDGYLAALSAHPMDREPRVCCNLGCASCAAQGCVEDGPLEGQSTAYLRGRYAWERAGEMGARASTSESFDVRSLAHTTEFEGRLVIEDVSQLPALALHRVDDLFIIRTALRSLDGLQQLRTVDGGFVIRQNSQLSDISALDPSRGGSLRSLGGSYPAGMMTDNPMLSECAITALNEQLASAGSPGAFHDYGSNLACGGTCDGPQCLSP